MSVKASADMSAKNVSFFLDGSPYSGSGFLVGAIPKM